MWVKFIFALIPIVWLIISLTALKMSAAKAAVISLILAIILAITAFQLPVVDTLTGTLEGILGGLIPIVYIIVAAMFTSKVTLKSGAMQKIQDMLCGLTTDKRVLVLLIAWGFLEAIAGFGTAVAIPASILMTFGINPIEASVICLVANTTPTAFGAVGLPVITLAQTAGLDGGGVKSIKGVGFITFMSGLAFALPQILVAKYVGAELPAIAGSIVCILVTALLAKRHKDVPEYSASTGDIAKHSAGELLQACAPFILVFVFVLAASSLFPAVNSLLNSATFEVPGLHWQKCWSVQPQLAVFTRGLDLGGYLHRCAGDFRDWVRHQFQHPFRQIAGFSCPKPGRESDLGRGQQHGRGYCREDDFPAIHHGCVYRYRPGRQRRHDSEAGLQVVRDLHRHHLYLPVPGRLGYGPAALLVLLIF